MNIRAMMKRAVKEAGLPSREIEGFRGTPVQWSHELERIANLPRRQIDVNDPAAARAWTEHLRKPVDKCDCVARWGFCITELRPIQGWALEEASDANGLLGPIGVGHGKEGVCLLAPWAFNSKHAVLLLPANLKSQFLTRDYPQWSVHFKTPSLAGGPFSPGKPVLNVISYNELSSPRFSALLNQIGPDLIILNEVQNVGNRTAARTKRFLRYVSERAAAGKPVRIFAVSGTLTKRSIKDYAHTADLALKEGSPLPREYPVVEEWAGALDPQDFPTGAGELRRFCEAGEHVRQGFRRRLVETAGVVATEEGALDTLLSISDRRGVKVPAPIESMLETVRREWQRPDGEELVDAIQMKRVCRELACGFFYRWRWPRMEPEPVIDEWLKARKEWHKELREKLKHSKEHMDSPFLLGAAAYRWYRGYVYIDPETRVRQEIPPRTMHGPKPVWPSLTWEHWHDIKDTAQPVTEAVWLDDFLLKDVAEWAKSNLGIIWYDSACVGPRLAKLAGLPHYGGGPDASANIIREQGERGIVASIRSHGTGKNLQMFDKNLIVQPPSDGAAWEQLLARTHRPGQKADEVTALVYRHTKELREGIDTALNRAQYIQDTMGSKQKLLYCTLDFEEWDD